MTYNHAGKKKNETLLRLQSGAAEMILVFTRWQISRKILCTIYVHDPDVVYICNIYAYAQTINNVVV